MTYREYIKLTENFGFERKNICCYYMGHMVCIFWFDNSSYDEQDILNSNVIVKIVNDYKVVNESTDKEQIKNFIIKRIEDIKAIIVDNKLKTMEKDFE